MTERRASPFRAVIAALGVMVTYCAAAVLVLVAASLASFTPPQISQKAIPLLITAVIGLPLLAAGALARVLRRKEWLPSLRLRGPLLTAVLLLYGVTMVFGLPAVQTYADTWAVKEYKRDKASGNVRVWESHPYIATYFAAPILPGIVVTYHEYQLDGLYGFGGFEVYAWYGVGVSTICQLPLWLS